MKRRLLIFGVMLLACLPLARADEAFDFEMLQFRAKALAGQPYKPKPNRVPAWLQKFSYDQHREIRFDPKHAWWREEDLPFQLQFFHPGWLFNEMVQINELDGKQAKRIDFSPKLFTYGDKQTGAHPFRHGLRRFSHPLCAQQRRLIWTNWRFSWARATSAPSGRASTTVCPPAGWR